MMIQFFTDLHTRHWVLLPTISVAQTECSCCDEDGPVVVAIDWLCFSAGIAFDTVHSNES